MHRAAPSLNRSSLSRHLFPKNAVLASASMRMLANSSPEPGFASGVETASPRCRAAACLAWSSKIIPISGMSEYRPFEVICTRPFRKTKRVEPWSTYVRDVRSLPREGPALERHCSAAATRLPCHRPRIPRRPMRPGCGRRCERSRSMAKQRRRNATVLGIQLALTL